MECVGPDFGVYIGKADVELLDGIPSIDCCEVRGVLGIWLERLPGGERLPTDRLVIGNGVSCLGSTIDRPISQCSEIDRYFLLLRSATVGRRGVGMIPLTHMRSQLRQVDSKRAYLILRSKRTDYVQ